MTDPVDDPIKNALRDPNLTVESDGDRVTRRSVKELLQLNDLQKELRGEPQAPFATFRDTRYDG